MKNILHDLGILLPGNKGLEMTAASQEWLNVNEIIFS